MSTSLTYLDTSRGGKKLLVNGFLYRINRKKETKSYWKCDILGCKTSAVLEEGQLCQQNGTHCHAPYTDSTIWAKKKVVQMKSGAKDQPLKAIPQLYKEAVSEMNTREDADEIASVLPMYGSCKSTLYRKRNEHLPARPANRESLVLTGEWASTIDGRDFVLANDGTKDKIVVLGTAENLQKVCSAKVIYMDGTFKASPSLFYQLYSIHAFIYGKMFPLLFCLLPDKARLTYIRLLDLLVLVASNRGLVFKPPVVFIDFEMATIQAIKDVFPSTIIKGCFFHFTQALWRHVQSLGLAGQYKEDEKIRKAVRRIGALPLVPAHEIDNVWLDVAAEAPVQLENFLNYVVETWIDDISPKYSRSLWSHWESGATRTNNNVEGWHSGFKKVVVKVHPNIYELVSALKKEQSANEGLMRQLRAGNPLPPKKKKYRDLEVRLVNLKEHLLNGTTSLVKYVNAVSNLINFHE